MRFLRRRGTEEAGFDLAPMLDVVFLLNIFFLLTSSYYLLSGVKIDVPTGAAVTLEAPDVIVSVTPEGRIYMEPERRPVPENELFRRLKAKKAEKPDLSVLIRGDEAVRFGRIVDVYSICRAAGVEKLRVQTKPGVWSVPREGRGEAP